jgi:hypothetical protein
VDLEKVREEWEQSGAILQDIFDAAELYGINEDLFRWVVPIKIIKI